MIRNGGRPLPATPCCEDAPMRLEHWLLPPHDWVPNHPFLPVLLYRQAERDGDAAGFERRFAAHGWPPHWRDGIYDDHHDHSTAHEVLGVASGSARLLIGGPGGTEATLAAGDALLLPAGSGHCCIASSSDFLVVGAYPAGQDWDICRQAPSAEMTRRIAQLPFPPSDPVAGAQGPLLQHWKMPEDPR
ncbi:cupin [Xanthomonas graminis]|uniref:cupin n=1 Tax=Xanthomonas graminis TaxID=3390026 RepID=UPI00253FADFC|nr:cupin [Xanthomonas translucens]